MIRKHSLLLGFSLSAALLLAGCTSDLSQGGGSGEVPLRLSAAPTTGLTRAADGLYTNTTGFDGGEQVEVYVNSSTKHGTYQVNSTSKTALDATNAANTQYYPTTGDVNLYAVYPAASATNGSHTVKYDQTSDDNYKASDLMYASKTVTQAQKTSTQELQFGHQLVKLKVQIIKAAGVGSVTKVEMQNVKRKVTVTANTSSMSLTDLTSATGETGTEANSDKILVFSGSNTSTSEQTYAVVFPVQSWSNQDFITVTADGQTATYKLTKDDFTFGHEYTLTLNINAAALGNTVSIDTWSNGGSATINPTASELYIEDIDPVVYTGSAQTPNFTIYNSSNTQVATQSNASTYFTIYWQNNTNAGIATVAAVGKTGTDYAGKACAKNFTIQKADPIVTAPTAKPSLLYTGSAQQLINAGSTTGGTLQYSLDNSTWSSDATTITGTAAQEYTVYYKVVGNDNYNDVTQQSITASITYRSISSATTADIGKVVCAAGHLHDAKTAVPSGCTAVGVLGKVTSTGHGLIVALKDAKYQDWDTINSWSSITAYASTTLKLLPSDDARGTLASYTDLGGYSVSNWCVGQKTDYESIFTNLGSTTGLGSAGKTYDSNVCAYFTSGSNGDAFDYYYWSATEYDSDNGWYFNGSYWDSGSKDGPRGVRPLLAF